MRDLGHHRDDDEPDREGRPIDTIERRAPRATRSAFAGVLACLLLGFAAAGVLAAAPAAAIDDPTRPDARVTHGPSCRPGGLVVEVVAGTVPYAVRLATTRNPAGEDEAELRPGETVVLRTGDVAPGETIDGRLEYAARDGSGTTYVDELEGYTFTRPTVEDCEAATAPPPSTPPPSPAPEPTPTPIPTPDPGPTQPGEPTPAPSPSPTLPPSPTPTPEPTPTPTPSVPGPTAPTPDPPQPSEPAPQAAENRASVPAGGVVRVRVEGYRPGEQVTIALHGSGEVLATATADGDGAVAADVRIPARTSAGPTALTVVGERPTAVADVPLEVAAAATGTSSDAASLLPLLAAAGALTATGAGLLSATSRRRPGSR